MSALDGVSFKIIAAMRNDDMESAKRLIDENPGMVSYVSSLGSMIYEATKKQKIDVVRYLLDTGGDPNAGWITPLKEAAANGNVEIMQLLIDRGAKIQTESQGVNPLFSAIGLGHPAAVQFLLEAGIDPEIRYADDGGMDAMSHAILQGQWEIGHQIACWIGKGDRAKGDEIFHNALSYVEEKAETDLSQRRRIFFDGLNS